MTTLATEEPLTDVADLARVQPLARVSKGRHRREVARARALSLARRAADMREAAAVADLANRRRVLLEAAARFRRLAQQQLAIARSA